MGFLAQAAAELSFGDFCTGDLFYDTYLRADASKLRERTVTGSFLQKEFQRNTLTSYIPVDENVPALKAQGGYDFVLAHGAPFETVACLTDDCEIATRLGRESSDGPSGRLTFAPVTPLKEEERHTLTASNWGRILIGEEVVELRRTFAVAAEDIAQLESSSSLSRRTPDDDDRLRLATWWAAYACRRGPLVDAVNLAKLARIGEAHGDSARAGRIEETLKVVTALAWQLQGHGIERAGEEHDDFRGSLSGADWNATVETIRDELEQLEAAVLAARAAL